MPCLPPPPAPPKTEIAEPGMPAAAASACSPGVPWPGGCHGLKATTPHPPLPAPPRPCHTLSPKPTHPPAPRQDPDPLSGVGPIGAVALELWSVDRGYVFDNILIARGGESAALARALWKARHDDEVKGEGEGRRCWGGVGGGCVGSGGRGM